ncbi:lipopolysaccharide assembly LapA domain-containing protein [Anaerobacillus sp. MEB173]|uniref:LapA family protein n=1 Tax=Anaerobacillus sp. MEB173 TaxID=3383345 RepID=UPI003F8E28E7
MKGQWTLIFGFIFALIISVFAVINVNSVTVNYVFGTAQWPLIIVILTSVLMGGLIVGSVGLYKVFRLQQQLKKVTKEKEQLKIDLEKCQQGETVTEIEAEEVIEEDGTKSEG